MPDKKGEFIRAGRRM